MIENGMHWQQLIHFIIVECVQLLKNASIFRNWRLFYENDENDTNEPALNDTSMS